MKVEVETPPEYVGDVIGDLSRRRAMVNGQEANEFVVKIDAEVPLSEMFGYATDLRSQTQGRASYSMEPLKYAEAPTSVAAAVIEARKNIFVTSGVKHDCFIPHFLGNISNV